MHRISMELVRHAATIGIQSTIDGSKNDQYKKNLTSIHSTKFLRRKRVYKKRKFLKKLRKFKINFY